MGLFYETTQRLFSSFSRGKMMMQRMIWGRGQALSVAWSPNGKILGVGTSLGVSLHDSFTLETKGALTVNGRVADLQFLDALTLLTVSGDVVAIKSIEQDSTLRMLLPPIPTLQSVAIAWNGMFAALDCGTSIDVYQVNSGAHLLSLPGIAASLKGSIAFTPEGSLLAVAVAEKCVELWNVADRRQERVLRTDKDVWGTAFIAGQPWLLTVGECSLELRNIYDGDLVRIINSEYPSIERFAVSPDGRLVAIASEKVIQIWRLHDGECILTLRQHSGGIRDLVFSPNSRRLAIVASNWLSVWCMQDGTRVDMPHIDSVEGYWGNISNVAFSPDGASLITAGDTTAVWQLADQRLLRCFPQLECGGPARGIAISPDNSLIAIATDEQISVYRWLDGHLYTCEVGLGRSEGMAFCWRHKHLVALGSEAVHIWDAWSGKLISTWEEPVASADDMAIAADGSIIATLEQEYIRIWDIDARKALEEIQIDYEPNSIALSADGNLVAVVSDHSVEIWDINQHRLKATLPGLVERVMFSPHGRHLAAINNTAIVLWDIERVEPTAKFADHVSTINGLAFSPDGQLLASGSCDGTVRLWFCSN